MCVDTAEVRMVFLKVQCSGSARASAPQGRNIHAVNTGQRGRQTRLATPYPLLQLSITEHESPKTRRLLLK